MFSNIVVRFPKREGNARLHEKIMYHYHSANRIFCEINIVASSYNAPEIVGNPNAAIRAGYVLIVIAKSTA